MHMAQASLLEGTDRRWACIQGLHRDLGLLQSPVPLPGHLPHVLLSLWLSPPHRPHSPRWPCPAGLRCEAPRGGLGPCLLPGWPGPGPIRKLAPAGSRGQGRGLAGPAWGGRENRIMTGWRGRVLGRQRGTEDERQREMERNPQREWKSKVERE